MVEAARLDPTAETTRIKPVSRSRPLPVSSSQHRIWALMVSWPTKALYTMPIVICLAALDVPALARAFADVVARHETLRTRILTTRRKTDAVH